MLPFLIVRVLEIAGGEFGSLINLCYLLYTLIFSIVNNLIHTEKSREIMNSHLLPHSPNTLALSYQHCAFYANGSPIF